VTCVTCCVRELLTRDGVTFFERPFSRDEALAAKEAFVTSATNLVMPEVKVGGQMIGQGVSGTIVRRLRDSFHKVVQATAA
jgi:D-alanine transaminase